MDERHDAERLEQFRQQLERSSLGTAGARQLRSRVPASVVEEITDRIRRQEQAEAPGAGPAATERFSLTLLVPRAARGDSAAWLLIIERFTDMLWSVARSYRLSHDDAAQVVQATWMGLLEHLTTIERPEALPGWLVATARREAVQLMRQHARDSRHTGIDDGPRQAPVLRVVEQPDEGRDAQLWEAFGRLPENCQRLLRVLMMTDRPNYVEVAEALSMPVGSIGPTRVRCLARLSALVREPIANSSDGPGRARGNSVPAPAAEQSDDELSEADFELLEELAAIVQTIDPVPPEVRELSQALV